MTLFLLLYFNIFKTNHIVVAKLFVVKILSAGVASDFERLVCITCARLPKHLLGMNNFHR